jgi:hypothetical protein
MELQRLALNKMPGLQPLLDLQEMSQVTGQADLHAAGELAGGRGTQAAASGAGSKPDAITLFDAHR